MATAAQETPSLRSPVGESQAAKGREGRPQEHEEERLGHLGRLPQTPALVEKPQAGAARLGRSSQAARGTGSPSTGDPGIGASPSTFSPNKHLLDLLPLSYGSVIRAQEEARLCFGDTSVGGGAASWGHRASGLLISQEQLHLPPRLPGELPGDAARTEDSELGLPGDPVPHLFSLPPPHLYSWSEGSTEITAPEICVQVNQTPRQGRGVRSSEGKLGRTPTSQLPEGRGAVLTTLGLLPPLASHVRLCLPWTCRALGLSAVYPSHAQGLSSYLF